MDKIIAGVKEAYNNAPHEDVGRLVAAARRLDECRSFLERLAAGEPAPEKCTYEEWAKELLR